MLEAGTTSGLHNTTGVNVTSRTSRSVADTNVTDVSFSVSCSPKSGEDHRSMSPVYGDASVSHSQSDVGLCENNRAITPDDNVSVKKCASLDQKKVNNTSPYFGRRRKVFKKDKSRSSSMPNRNVTLLDVRHRCSSNAMDDKSPTENCTPSTPQSRGKGSRKSVSAPTTPSSPHESPTTGSGGSSMPISIPGGKGSKKGTGDSSRSRKRSIFKGILKGKGSSLKRASSEMLFTPRTESSLKTQSLRAGSTSSINLTETHDIHQHTAATPLSLSRSLHAVQEGKVSLPRPSTGATTPTTMNYVPAPYPKSASLPASASKGGEYGIAKRSPVFNPFFTIKKKSKEKSLKTFRPSSSILDERSDGHNENGTNNGSVVPGVRPMSMLEFKSPTSSDVKKFPALTSPGFSPGFSQAQIRSATNRGPLKIMSVFKHWVSKHPKVRHLFCIVLKIFYRVIKAIVPP